MALFTEDLAKAFHLTAEISRLRAEQWRPLDIDPLLNWQERAFSTLAAGEGLAEIDRAWRLLHDAPLTQKQAELFHEELNAVLAVETSVLHLRNAAAHSGREAPKTSAMKRLGSYLKRALGLFKTFLESLKEILGDALSLPWKIALQIAIEASEVFAK